MRSTLNTSYITGLDMCKVCTEAVHSVECYMCAKTTERRKNSIFLHVANSSGSKNKTVLTGSKLLSFKNICDFI